MKIAAGISLIPELTNTPHIPHGNLEQLCKLISDNNYDGIELFPRNANDISLLKIKEITHALNLKVCAIGTGAGKVLFGLALTDPNADIRKMAINYISDIIEVASDHNAIVIIGSMQGSFDKIINKEQTLEWLTEGLVELAKVAEGNSVNIVFEPINRYESNLVNKLSDGVELIKKIGCDNVKLLADLFHMNIEESSIEKAIIQTGSNIGHVHFADSNRFFPGLGHSNFRKIFKALNQINYDGYISTEALVADKQADLKHAMKIFNECAN